MSAHKHLGTASRSQINIAGSLEKRKANLTYNELGGPSQKPDVPMVLLIHAISGRLWTISGERGGSAERALIISRRSNSGMEPRRTRLDWDAKARL